MVQLETILTASLQNLLSFQFLGDVGIPSSSPKGGEKGKSQYLAVNPEDLQNTFIYHIFTQNYILDYNLSFIEIFSWCNMFRPTK